MMKGLEFDENTRKSLVQKRKTLLSLCRCNLEKAGMGALFSLVNLLREFLLRIQLSYIRLLLIMSLISFLLLPIIWRCSIVIK